MAGKKLMFVVSLSSIKPHKCFSAGRGPYLHNYGFAARLLDDSRNAPINAVGFSGKSDFFR